MESTVDQNGRGKEGLALALQCFSQSLHIICLDTFDIISGVSQSIETGQLQGAMKNEANKVRRLVAASATSY